jgi:D-xylose transport system substrate-binding protein
MKSRRWVQSLLGLGLMASIALVGCGSTTSSGGASNPIEAAKGCKNIAVLLPETASSSRWEGQDHPMLEKAIKDAVPGAKVTVQNANGNDDTQISQAESALTSGACILVVAPHDKAKAATIVAKAKQDKVPVIAYDRMIASEDLNFYVSFDGVTVGEAQGQYIVDHYKDAKYGVGPDHNNMVMINGSQDDDNAVLFRQGAHKKLDDLINSKALNNVFETYTPNWDNPTAQNEMDGALTKYANNIQVAYVANDGMAGTVIASLKAQQLTGKVLVTGQDATVPGLQNILLGYQAMTVYKPIPKEAEGVAQLVKALVEGKDTSTIATRKQNNGMKDIPSVLLAVQSVDKTNMKDTVIKDGFATATDVCKDIPSGTDTNGVCP